MWDCAWCLGGKKPFVLDACPVCLRWAHWYLEHMSSGVAGGGGTWLLGVCLRPEEPAQLLPALLPAAPGQLGQTAPLLRAPSLPSGTVSMCDCASLAPADLQLSAANSTKPCFVQMHCFAVAGSPMTHCCEFSYQG